MNRARVCRLLRELLAELEEPEAPAVPVGLTKAQLREKLEKQLRRRGLYPRQNATKNEGTR